MYAPVFQQLPIQPRGWWLLLRRLVERIYEVEMPDDVDRVAGEAKGLEEVLGRPLPPSVIEWMAFTRDLRHCSEQAAGDFWHYSFQVEDFPEQQSISLNRYYDCMKWGVAYQDLTQDDPPVSAYDYVQRHQGFVRRKTYAQAPLTHYALHCVLNYSPWLSGWTAYSTMGSELQDPRGFVEQLRGTNGALVSEPFGSLTFAEGPGWLAFVMNGYSPYGRQKALYLRFKKTVRLRDIPEPIRAQVQMKPSHLRERIPSP
jgi:hypothetical protein